MGASSPGMLLRAILGATIITLACSLNGLMSDRVIPETAFQDTKATRMSDFEYGLAEKNRYAEAKLAIDSLRGSGLDATQVIAKSKKSISEKVEQQQRTLDALALDTNCDSAVGQKTAALQIKSSAGDADTELRNAMDATIDFADPLYSNLEDQSCDWLWEDQAYLAAEARYQAAVVSNNSATGAATLLTALIQTDQAQALELNECHCHIKRATKSAHKSAQQNEQFVQAWVGAEYMQCILDKVSEAECASRTKPVPTLTLPQFSSAVESAVCAGATTESTVLAE